MNGMKNTLRGSLDKRRTHQHLTLTSVPALFILNPSLVDKTCQAGFSPDIKIPFYLKAKASVQSTYFRNLHAMQTLGFVSQCHSNLQPVPCRRQRRSCGMDAHALLTNMHAHPAVEIH
jgi:hypothetical protein